MGNRIKELREKNNVSQGKLANLLGMTRQGISLYEKNERKNIPDSIWQKLADYFGVSVDYLKGYGYSKEYIYNLLLNACHDGWHLYGDEKTVEIKNGEKLEYQKIRDDELYATSVVSNYCVITSIKVPTVEQIQFDFWANNFDFVFDNPAVNILLTTKDKVDDDFIIETTLREIDYQYTKLSKSMYVKLNSLLADRENNLDAIKIETNKIFDEIEKQNAFETELKGVIKTYFGLQEIYE